MPNANYINMVPTAAGARNVRAYNNKDTAGPITGFVSPNSVSPYGWDSNDVAAPCPDLPGFDYNYTTGTYSNVYKAAAGSALANTGTYVITQKLDSPFGKNETIPPTITPNSRGPFPGWEIDQFN